MNKILKFDLAPEVAFDEDNLKQFLEKKYPHWANDQFTFLLKRRSVDARGKRIKVPVEIEVFDKEGAHPLIEYKKDYPNVTNAEPVVIIGAGPAGMFAALRLLELGLKPIVLERGKDVRTRRRDLAAINKHNLVNPDSNYCFGEGGAGTYSDGKLYTRSKKRGDFRRTLEIFVAHGADPRILVDTHPHIGTNKLPKIVQDIRESIINAGGEFHFNTRVERFVLKGKEIHSVLDQHGNEFKGIGVILATGHSARDIFESLHRDGIDIEAKPFALGVRVEHAQSLIDSIQYGMPDRGYYLPAAPYSLVSQVSYKGERKGVFSFCMCPGGFIVPSATAPGEIVVNGMSPSRRDSKYANSGIVVSIDESDWVEYKKFGPLAALEYQKAVEQKAFEAANQTQAAPAQLLGDFVRNRHSRSLLETSYQPGLTSTKMDQVLPEPVAHRLRFGFKDFGKKMKGYLSNDAQIVGVESRTSSPVRIPRDKITFEHVSVKRLFPAGEGPGYAGGIASAAIDGERCAEQLVKAYQRS